MNSVRILHTADLHLGIERLSLENKSKARRAEVRRTFHTILKLAEQQRVELILIAGDLFDSVKVPEELETEVRDAFAEIAPIQVAICAGNHDPATPDSVYNRPDFWPENVHIFASSIQSLEIESLGVRIIGAGFTGAYSVQTMLRRMAVPTDDYINIGLFHGDLVAEGNGSDYNPIYRRQIENSGFRYLALGHIHKRSEPETLAGTCFAYAGSPEGQRFGEDGELGVYIAEVSNEYCDVDFFPVCTRRYTSLSVDVSKALSPQDIVDEIKSSMQKVNGDDFEEQIYKVTLKGTPARDIIKSTEEIRSQLSDIWYVEVKDRTRPYVDEEELVMENSLRGIFVKQMLDLRGKIPENQREMALRLGLKAFYGEIEID